MVRKGSPVRVRQRASPLHEPTIERPAGTRVPDGQAFRRRRARPQSEEM
jgi:hypothetical protein